MNSNQWAYQVVHARKQLRHGKRPTDMHVRIAWILARWQNAQPSHAKIARAADCSRGTVVNALKRLRGLDLLGWLPQFTRLRGGWMARTANRYLFLSPASLPAASSAGVVRKKKKPIFSCPAKFAQRSPPQPSWAEVEAARRALAAVAARPRGDNRM